MRRLYFFDKQFNYKDVIVINNFSPIVDIVSTQSFKIETPLMPVVASGDICILKDNNEVVFIGNILNVEESEKKTKTITISYIDELFNINGEVEDLSGNIITWITNTLTTNFISVSDNLQKISLSIVNNCATAYSGTYTFESTNIKDCLRNIFNYSGVYVDFEIDFADNGSIDSLVCNIRSNIEENTIKLKYNMPIISEIKRTVTNSQNINKLVVLPDSSVTGGSRYEFYLLKDGTISTDASNVNRFENVKQDIKYYASDFTAESLLNTAKEVLGGEQFNHSIGFYIKHNNTFNISLYKKILFYDKDNIVYNSIITKIQYGTEFDYVELGVVRLKLTDKLQKKDTKTATSSSSSGGGSYVLPQANEIVIGYDTTGHGSNTATIGNSSITDNYFTGNVRTTGDILIPTGKTLKINNVDALSTKAVQPYIARNYSGGNGIRLIGTYNYSTSVGDTRPLFYMVGKQGHGNGTSYLWQGEFIFGVSTTGVVTAKAILKVSDGTYGKFYYRHDTANKILYLYIYTGQYSSAYFSDLVQINAGNYSSYFTLASAGSVTGDTVTEGINILYPSSGGEMALTDASNLTSGNVTSWHTKLNDLTKPSAGSTITGKQAVVVDSYLSSDSKTWFRKWSDGWKECGGIDGNSSKSSRTISLPLSFASLNYFALISYKQDDISNGAITINPYTVNSIKIKKWAATNANMATYYCCGY